MLQAVGGPPVHLIAALTLSEPAGGAAAAENAAARPTPDTAAAPRITPQARFKARKEERLQDKSAMRREVLDKAVAPEDKQRIRCEYALRWRHSLFSCEGCWLVPHLCVCSRLAATATTNTKVIISVHPSEWGKATNTGCMAPMTLPKDARMLMRGLPEHDRELQEVLDDPTHTVAILFPGTESISAGQLADIAREKTGGRVVILALDATWGGARRLRLSLPRDMMQVKLTPEACLVEHNVVSLLRPVRAYRGDQTVNGRVSTLEATAALLRELGEPPQVYDTLIDNLRVKVSGMLSQKQHRKPAAEAQEAAARGRRDNAAGAAAAAARAAAEDEDDEEGAFGREEAEEGEEFGGQGEAAAGVGGQEGGALGGGKSEGRIGAVKGRNEVEQEEETVCTAAML